MKSYILIPTRKSNSSSPKEKTPSPKVKPPQYTVKRSRRKTVNDRVCKIISKQQCNKKKQIPSAPSTMLISKEDFQNTKFTPEHFHMSIHSPPTD